MGLEPMTYCLQSLLKKKLLLSVSLVLVIGFEPTVLHYKMACVFRYITPQACFAYCTPCDNLNDVSHQVIADLSCINVVKTNIRHS